MATSTEYSVVDLRRMDEQEARNTLPVAQFERWQKLRELDEGAKQTQEEWDDQAEQVEDLVVRADPEALGTELDLMGNPVLVRVSPDDAELQAIANSLEDNYGDIEETDPTDLDEQVVDEIADHLLQMLDCSLVRWNGHTWDALGPETRQDVLDQAREKWGLDGLMLAWVEIGNAVEEDMGEKMGVVEKFRGEAGRGHR